MAENTASTPEAGDADKTQQRRTTGAAAAPARASAEASQSGGSSGGESKRNDGSLRSEMENLHESRTVVPGRDDVDARLDNRTPDMLEAPPQPGPDDPKPQHVDGPDLAGQADWTRDALQKKRS